MLNKRKISGKRKKKTSNTKSNNVKNGGCKKFKMPKIKKIPYKANRIKQKFDDLSSSDNDISLEDPQPKKKLKRFRKVVPNF